MLFWPHKIDVLEQNPAKRSVQYKEDTEGVTFWNRTSLGGGVCVLFFSFHSFTHSFIPR